MHHIISTGSSGNSVIYFNSIMVDIGVPFSLIKPFYKDIKIVLLTHCHKDHINISTLRKLAMLRPTLRIGCGEWMLDYLEGINNVDIFEIGKLYNYGIFQLSPVKLYHDVPNCGYRIFKDDKKIFHATDTNHLKGITAKGYDLYALEHNYNEETVFDVIRQLESQGLYAHQKGAINSHLSEQQAREFIYNNRKEDSEVIRLHESTFDINTIAS